MVFRKAEKADITEIGHLYDSVCDYLAEHVNYPCWEKGEYPTTENAAKAFEEGKLYVVTENEKITGSVVLTHQGEAGYANAKWLTKDDYSKILVVFTLCVHPDYFGKGIGEALLKGAEETARLKGCGSIRLDVVKGNLPAEKLYKKCGFLYIGTVSLGYEELGLPWFDLYEKVL